MKKKQIRNIFLTLGLSIVILCGGTYVYILHLFTRDIFMNSEKYIVAKTPKKLILKIEQFKKNNPQYYLITTNEQGEEYIYQDYDTPKHYHVFFYFKDLNLTIQCLLNPINEEESLLSLYAVSYGINFASWKSINTDDLTNEENKKLKKKFEVEILDKLGKWTHKRWYN